MNSKRWMRFFIVILLGFGTTTFAESVYVIDTLRVGIRATPEQGAKTLEVIQTGHKLQVLQRGEKHYKIKTEGGRVGWIRKRYVDEMPPAGMRLEKVQKQFAELEQGVEERVAREQKNILEQLDSHKQQLGEVQEANLSLEVELATLKEEKRALEDELEMSNMQNFIPNEYRLPALAALILVVFILGSLSGAKRVHHNMNRRFGGLDIRL